MPGLFRKVCRGNYEKIPSNYSADLAHMLKMMLQVDAEKRPDCDDIMNMTIYQKRAVDL